MTLPLQRQASQDADNADSDPYGVSSPQNILGALQSEKIAA